MTISFFLWHKAVESRMRMPFFHRANYDSFPCLKCVQDLNTKSAYQKPYGNTALCIGKMFQNKTIKHISSIFLIKHLFYCLTISEAPGFSLSVSTICLCWAPLCHMLEDYLLAAVCRPCCLPSDNMRGCRGAGLGWWGRQGEQLQVYNN